MIIYPTDVTNLVKYMFTTVSQHEPETGPKLDINLLYLEQLEKNVHCCFRKILNILGIHQKKVFIYVYHQSVSYTSTVQNSTFCYFCQAT